MKRLVGVMRTAEFGYRSLSAGVNVHFASTVTAPPIDGLPSDRERGKEANMLGKGLNRWSFTGDTYTCKNCNGGW